ncbi:hypothetical protein EGR_10091 [Echinococcus granulosus]|uniref:Uncharacterized protein n=1 Tax=Echinococcus granulosus TaxID=6210 RepID=W6U3C4_ECHGR|nr:hypothetical protein EGR_10091 [Echinococcus granulosus]EUB55046.1 hypothetical protein EGR_10091 [Echinococcus granulosus]
MLKCIVSKILQIHKGSWNPCHPLLFEMLMMKKGLTLQYLLSEGTNSKPSSCCSLLNSVAPIQNCNSLLMVQCRWGESSLLAKISCLVQLLEIPKSLVLTEKLDIKYDIKLIYTLNKIAGIHRSKLVHSLLPLKELQVSLQITPLGSRRNRRISSHRKHFKANIFASCMLCNNSQSSTSFIKPKQNQPTRQLKSI